MIDFHEQSLRHYEWLEAQRDKEEQEEQRRLEEQEESDENDC
jgi:hypothetical protein